MTRRPLIALLISCLMFPACAPAASTSTSTSTAKVQPSLHAAIAFDDVLILRTAQGMVCGRLAEGMV